MRAGDVKRTNMHALNSLSKFVRMKTPASLYGQKLSCLHASHYPANNQPATGVVAPYHKRRKRKKEREGEGMNETRGGFQWKLLLEVEELCIFLHPYGNLVVLPHSCPGWGIPCTCMATMHALLLERPASKPFQLELTRSKRHFRKLREAKAMSAHLCMIEEKIVKILVNKKLKKFLVCPKFQATASFRIVKIPVSTITEIKQC